MIGPIRQLCERFLSLFRRRKLDSDLSEEIAAHVEMAVEDNIRAGMNPGEARRQAMIRLGGVEAAKELHRDARGLPLIESSAQDIRYGLRILARSPMFTAAALLTLAIGIGANTAIFGVIDSILIRPLTYPHAEDLVDVLNTAPALPAIGGSLSCSASMYFTYREESRTFQQFGLWQSGGANVTGIAEPELPRALLVTYGVLDALGVKPLLGRWFSQADDTPGSAETVMLTHGYWQRRFGGDKSIVGRTLTINSMPHTVIGVMPEAFRFQHDPELILPLRLERNKLSLGEFSDQGLARLKPGVTMVQANTDLARMLAIWLNAWPRTRD